MSISKKEFYGSFLSGFNGNLIKLRLTPLQDISDLKERFKDNSKKEKDNPIVDIAITKDESLEKDKKDKTISNVIDLEVLFNYNKSRKTITIIGQQITSVLGYPSSSLYFSIDDIEDIKKTNSSYEFMVKSSFYLWGMTLSSKGIIEEDFNEDTANTK